jgi:hypothetical protein
MRFGHVLLHIPTSTRTRPLAEIDAEIEALEEEIQGLLRDVTSETTGP